MDASEPTPSELRRVIDRQDALRAIVMIQQAIVLVVLLIATLVAPLTSVLPADADDEPIDKAGGFFASLGYFFTEEAETFGDRETHPNGLDAGLLFTRVGLILLLIAVIATLLAAIALWSAQQRARQRVLVAVGIALVVGSVVTFLGLTWLPDSELVTTATGWLWLPIAAGAWAFFHRWSREEVE
jgi:hypothetical protein